MKIGYLPCYVVNDRGEVGRSVQLNALQGSVVGIQHTSYALAVGIIWAPILKRK